MQPPDVPDANLPAQTTRASGEAGRPAATHRPPVRSRRRDVSRARSTQRQPGQPPAELSSPLVQEQNDPPIRIPDAAVVADVSADDLVPIGLDPTAELAEQFAVHARLTFRDPMHLRLALTHRSVLHDWTAAGVSAVHLGRPFQSNERLEFLGDAVLGAVVAEQLYGLFPTADEGALTSRRVALVRAETLVRWARQIDLADYLVLGYGERISESPRDRILAGAFEALIGAVMVDRGMGSARAFVNRFLREETDGGAEDQGRFANPKGYLQEVMQEQYRSAPVYRTVSTSGPDHAKQFTIEVLLHDERIGIGNGVSKRDAQQAAARDGLERLDQRFGLRAPVTVEDI